MSLLESSNIIVAGTEYHNMVETQDKDFKITFMNTLETFKEEINTSLEEIYEKIKQWMEMKRTVKGLKVEIGRIKEAQIK